MSIKPIFEQEASEEIKMIYKNIKKALDSQTLPVFFAYIGAFPEYLEYISEPLINNLRDQKFKNTMRQMTDEMIPLINDQLKKSDGLNDWITRYKHTPSFYHFQNDIETIFLLNLKIAFIFVGLRE